ncbi:MAG TPA: DUF1559 domain-containing protein, partial [Planctomycetaceae bacterium]|nr:DUF1559 domain-containing protein [Planctomycetaceae bacterium]
MTTRHAIAVALLAAGLYAAALLLFLPVTTSSPPTSRRTVCKNNLHQIGVALYSYHDRYGSFPPAYLADENGRQMHSWRVLLLPYLDEEARYEKYRFDEPWGGPNNRRLAVQTPSAYCCPSDNRLRNRDEALTSYLAVTDPGAAFNGDRAAALDDIRDGPAKTLLVVESPGPPMHWMQPDDLAPDELVRLLAADPGTELLHKGV